MTGRPFIERYKEHRGNIRHKHQKGTKLSKFIWKQKEFGKDIKIEDIKWSLKAKSVPYKPGSRYCDTCLSEKTYIALANPDEILNSRKEIIGKCPHKRDFKLNPLEQTTLQGGLPRDVFKKNSKTLKTVMH